MAKIPGALDPKEESAKYSASKAKSESSKAASESNKKTADDKNPFLKAHAKGREEGKFKPEDQSAPMSEAPKKSYADEKMDAVRKAMSESDPSYAGAPELGSADPMSDLPRGKFGAEGDEWTYEVGEDGTVTASIEGKSIPVKEGTEAYESIVAQLKSGQLSSLGPDDATEEV